MGHIGPNIMHSLADAAFGVCGFRVYNMQDGVSLAAEWSHSLNMLDIDISSIYEEVCEGATANTGVDVVVSCDQTKVFIGFFVNMRNKTRYTTVNSLSTFYGMKGSMLSDIVIDACVLEQMMDDGVGAVLHVDKHSTSCCFQFSEWQDQGHGFRLTATKGMVLLVLLLVLGVLVLHGLAYVWQSGQLCAHDSRERRLVWEAARTALCQYVVPVMYANAQNVSFCSGHE